MRRSRCSPFARIVVALAFSFVPAAAQEGEVEAVERIRVLDPEDQPTLLAGRTSAPVLGQVWDPVLTVRALRSADRAILLLSAEKDSHPIPGVGILFCAPPFEVVDVTTPGTPFRVPMPTNPALAGRRFTAQAVAANSNERIRLSANSLDVTIGTRGDVSSFYVVESSLDCSGSAFGSPLDCTQMFLGLDEEISITFNAPVDPASVTTTSVLFYDSTTGLDAPWTFAIDSDPRTLLISPEVSPGFYRLQLTGTNDSAVFTVRSVFGGRNEDGFLVSLLAL